MGKMEFGRIGVLCGGPSSEREISLCSGEEVYRALKERGYEVFLIDAVDDVERKIQKAKISVAFIALHGRFGEDGTIQKILESLEVPYTGSGVEASALAMDKLRAKKIFLEAGIPTPVFEVICLPDLRGSTEPPIPRLKPPFIVKPTQEGSTIGVSIVRCQKDFARALETAFNYGEKVLVEDFVEGREVTAAIVGDRECRVLPLIEIVPQDEIFSYHSKYSPKGASHIIPPRLGRDIQREIEEVSLRAHRVLGCEGFSRVDLMVSTEGDPYVLEVNTIPGLTRVSLVPEAARAAGMSLGDLCIELLELAKLRQTRLSLI